MASEYQKSVAIDLAKALCALVRADQQLRDARKLRKERRFHYQNLLDEWERLEDRNQESYKLWEGVEEDLPSVD